MRHNAKLSRPAAKGELNMTDSKEEVKRDDLGETPDPLGRSCSALLSDSLPLPSSTFFNAKPGTFPHELMQLINKHSIENGSNTPDFILAEYLKQCLEAFDMCVRRRDENIVYRQTALDSAIKNNPVMSKSVEKRVLVQMRPPKRRPQCDL